MGWAPAAATATDSPMGALAILGACGLAGFLLLVLGRRKDVEEPQATMSVPPDLEAMMRSGRPVIGGPGAAGAGQAGSTTGADGGPAPIWVKRLNDQAPPPPEPSRVMDGAYRG